jgi:glucose-6-phosphate 1-dehydrogenase
LEDAVTTTSTTLTPPAIMADFAETGTFQPVGDVISGSDHPVLYREIPPFLFGTVVKGLAKARLSEWAARKRRCVRHEAR